MASLTIENVTKSFGSTEVLKGVSINVQPGEFLVLVGPSGCGKSTLLNLIAGLETITSGNISVAGRVVNNVAPKDRDIAMVFQSYALYPNMNVYKNISFGLETRRVPKDEIDTIVHRVADILQIGQLLDRKPSQLSGGQRQRVAMGRAIARNPQVFLFDEPLSNLDAKLRVEMRTEIKKLHQRLDNTIVYVTHDQIEAMTLADRIAIMKGGHVQQLGTPHDVYEKPANLFVAGFIGSPSMNFMRTTLASDEGRPAVPVTEKGGRSFMLPITIPGASDKLHAGQDVIVGIRPEHITEHRPGAESPHIHTIECEVRVTEPTGPDTLIYVDVDGQEMVCRVAPSAAVNAGERMSLSVDMSKVNFFDPETEERIAL